MWILLIKKLPTVVSPPKMSIFWSVPWPDADYVESQKIRKESWGATQAVISGDYEETIELADGSILNELGGREPNWKTARKIMFLDEAIRIFSYEYSVPTKENLRKYIEESHELMAGTAAEDEIITEVKRGRRKEIYDAALCDGCAHAQATMVALGQDPTLEDAEYPAIGWYRCKPEYALFYCSEEEMTETDARGECAEYRDKKLEAV